MPLVIVCLALMLNKRLGSSEEFVLSSALQTLGVFLSIFGCTKRLVFDFIFWFLQQILDILLVLIMVQQVLPLPAIFLSCLSRSFFFFCHRHIEQVEKANDNVEFTIILYCCCLTILFLSLSF